MLDDYLLFLCVKFGALAYHTLDCYPPFLFGLASSFHLPQAMAFAPFFHELFAIERFRSILALILPLVAAPAG